MDYYQLLSRKDQDVFLLGTRWLTVNYEGRVSKRSQSTLSISEPISAWYNSCYTTWFIFWQNSYYLIQLLAKLLVHYLVQLSAKPLVHFLVQLLAKLFVHLSICESGTHQIQQVKVTHGRCNNSLKRHLDGAHKTFV